MDHAKSQTQYLVENEAGKIVSGCPDEENLFPDNKYLQFDRDNGRYCCKKTPPTTVEACRHLKEIVEPNVRKARFTPEEMRVTEDELEDFQFPDGRVYYYHPDQPDVESASTKEALLRKLKQYREPERHAKHLINNWKSFCDQELGSEEAWPSFE